MLYGEINIGDVLELKGFGAQSTKMLVTGRGEIMKYGAKKGDDKKFLPAFYVRSFSAIDDDPQMVEAAYLRQHCTRVAAEDLPQAKGDDGDNGDGAATDADSTRVEYETADSTVEYDEYSQGEAQDYSQADNRPPSDDDSRNRQAAPEKKPLPLKQPLRR